ncbi:cytosine deaminase [Klebsiella grimontii]|uniref:Cytosine deaminase n=1 Tax=Klebsiella grimontii TaxID=2058152 RepID=A0A7H4P815_9ENTR|nr:cytosine deaminase [Klebsiella grimontii]
MKIINARLRHQEALYTLDLQDGVIKSISAQAAAQTADASDIDAQQKLVIPPFVEPHIHLDATLTAGEPEWNMSGTLFEGIARWSQRKSERHRRRYAPAGAENHRQCCATTACSTCVPTLMSPTLPLTALEAMLRGEKRGGPILSICRSSPSRRRALSPSPADAN